jgi:drug/metabolite transporter (DMT)-like permease
MGTGEWAAIGTAVAWTLSSLIWTAAGKRIGALATSFLRLVIAGGFLAVYGRLARDLWLPSDAGSEVWLFLGLSGFCGFFVADLCLFKAFVLIGPRLTLLVQSLAPPLTALGSWLFLREGLSTLDCLGMAVTLCGVSWVILGRTPASSAAATPAVLRQGLLLALIGAVAQAFGFVFSKQGIGQYDAMAGTFIRVLVALVGFSLLITLTRRWPPVLSAVRNRGAMAIAVVGSIVGPVVGVALSLEAVRHCHAGVAATIINTTPVLILPCAAVIYRERISLRSAGGALLAVLGVALLVS